MKNLFTLLITSFLLSYSGNLKAQDFIALLEKADYKTLSVHMDDEVNVEINRDRQTLNRGDAIAKVRSKLKRFSPVKWEAMHQGKADNKEDNYLITKVYNSKDEGLRIFIHIEEIDGQKKICSIRFRKLLR